LILAYASRSVSSQESVRAQALRGTTISSTIDCVVAKANSDRGTVQQYQPLYTLLGNLGYVLVPHNANFTYLFPNFSTGEDVEFEGIQILQADNPGKPIAHTYVHLGIDPTFVQAQQETLAFASLPMPLTGQAIYFRNTGSESIPYQKILEATQAMQSDQPVVWIDVNSAVEDATWTAIKVIYR
jgi:hypothetical protein